MASAEASPDMMVRASAALILSTLDRSPNALAISNALTNIVGKATSEERPGRNEPQNLTAVGLDGGGWLQGGKFARAKKQDCTPDMQHPGQRTWPDALSLGQSCTMNGRGHCSGQLPFLDASVCWSWWPSSWRPIAAAGRTQSFRTPVPHSCSRALPSSCSIL